MLARWLTDPAAAAQLTISEVMSSSLSCLMSSPSILPSFDVGMGRPRVARIRPKKITFIFQDICSSKELRGTLLEAKVVGGLSNRALCRRVDVFEHVGPDETL